MINWVFSTHSPDTLQDCISNPVKYLNASERIDYQKFTVPKRQTEWLASRLLVKQLVSESVANGLLLPYPSIEIRKEASGVPYVYLADTGRLGWLSFSHSNGGIFAAFSRDSVMRFGVDIEYIEERSPLLFEDFFTKNESAMVNAAVGLEKDSLANLIWSAKESYLKAIEIGLQLDTRRVEIQCITLKPKEIDWIPVDFLVDHEPDTNCRVLFKVESNFVLTMCVTTKVESTLSQLMV